METSIWSWDWYVGLNWNWLICDWILEEWDAIFWGQIAAQADADHGGFPPKGVVAPSQRCPNHSHWLVDILVGKLWKKNWEKLSGFQPHILEVGVSSLDPLYCLAWQHQPLSNNPSSTNIAVTHWSRCIHRNVSRRYSDLQGLTPIRNRFLAQNNIKWQTCRWMKYIDLMATPA